MATSTSRRPVPPTKAAPAAGLLARAPQHVVIEHDEPPPAPPAEPAAPGLDEVDVAEHKRRQQEYRQWVAKMSSQSPAELRRQDEDEAEPAAAPAAVEDLEVRRTRMVSEAATEYRRQVAEMDPAEPRYVVGTRPPRPRVAGHVLAIGDVVPGAHAFPRLESWLNTGILVQER